MPFSAKVQAELLKCAKHILDPNSVRSGTINLYSYREQLRNTDEVVAFLRSCVELHSASTFTIFKSHGYFKHNDEQQLCIIVVPYDEDALSENARTYVVPYKIGGFRLLRDDEQLTYPA